MLKIRNLVFVIVLILYGLLVVYVTPLFADDVKLRDNIGRAKQSVFRLKFTNGTYTGTGFMINSLGNMLTCAHVVDSSADNSGKYVQDLLAENYIRLTIQGLVDTNITLDVVTFDVTVDTVIPNLDLAILTLNLKKPHYKETEQVPIVRSVFMSFFNSDSIWEGQEVFTCAYIKDKFPIPKPIIAKGMISTIRNDFYDPRMKNSVNILQLDLNISRGNSGAPIFLPDNGRVIGILDWGIFGDSKWQTGYAVALSTNQIVDKLKELKISFDFK